MLLRKLDNGNNNNNNNNRIIKLLFSLCFGVFMFQTQYCSRIRKLATILKQRCNIS